jgi:hypothetical protein
VLDGARRAFGTATVRERSWSPWHERSLTLALQEVGARWLDEHIRVVDGVEVVL